MKILIFGLPGSGKSTLSEPFAELVGGVWLNADVVRKEYDDWDFKVAVADFVCPTEEARQAFAPDYTVWMDTIKEGRFEDTNKMFEKPASFDYHVAEWFTDTDRQLAAVVARWELTHAV